MKIRAYLMLMAAAVTIPVIFVSGLSLNLLHDAGRDITIRSMHETGRATALMVEGELRASETRLRVLGTSAYLEAGDMRGFYQQMKRANRDPADGWTLVLDERGRQILNSSQPYAAKLPDTEDPSRAKAVLDGNRVHISNLLTGPITGRPLVAVTLPVVTESGKKYLLMEALNAEFFSRVLTGAGVPAGWTMALFDGNGKFIARQPDAERFVGKPARPELVAAAVASERGQIRHQTWEGVDSYDVFSRTADGKWTMAIATPVAEVEGAGRRAATIAALGFAIALVLATVAAVLFGRRLIRSISRVGEAAAMLGQGQRPPAVESAVSEMQDLHDALNKAAGLISLERESRKDAELERSKLLENEQRARKLAEEESRSKDAFLAMLGHELRNPLSAISAGIAVIKAAGSESAVAVHANEIISRQSAHLERIVDDLLDTARMLAGKITLIKKPIDLAESVQICVETLRATGRADGYTIRVDAMPLIVDADPARIEQILNNLVHNAIKYTPLGGEIDIHLHAADNMAVLEISDNGVGMRAELLDRIFDPFVQGKVSLDRSQGGLGIGLTLVRKLVELHGGSVFAYSEGEGAGSRFVIRLPLAALVQPTEVKSAPAAVQSAIRLLLVEDNPDAREMTAELLRFGGYIVTAVAGGKEALHEARSGDYRVAVIDIGLPDINGYMVAHDLRSMPQTRGMGLIALTGYGLASDVEAALRAGFDRHLVKPMNFDRLMEAIALCLSRGDHIA